MRGISGSNRLIIALAFFAVVTFLSSALYVTCADISESDSDSIPVYSTGSIVLTDDGGTFGNGWIEGENYRYHHDQRTLEIYEGIFNVDTGDDAAIDVRYSGGEFQILIHGQVTINDTSSGKCKYGYHCSNDVNAYFEGVGVNNILEIGAFPVASTCSKGNTVFDGETNGFIVKIDGLMTFVDIRQPNRSLINYSCDMNCPILEKGIRIEVYGNKFVTDSPVSNLHIYGGETTVNSYVENTLEMNGGKLNVNYDGEKLAAVYNISGYTFISGELNINTTATIGIIAMSDVYMGKSFYLTSNASSVACDSTVHYVEGAVKEGDERSPSLVIKYPILNPYEQIKKPQMENGDIGIVYDNRIAGQLVTITAMPDDDYYFVKWSDDDYGQTRTFSLVLDENDTVTLPTPTFHTDMCKVTLMTKGSGTVTGAGSYTHGTEVEITASPSLGYQFKEWSDGNKLPIRSIVVTEDIKLTAVFELKQYDVKLTAGEGGIVVGEGKYQIGTEVTVGAIPYDGYVFKEWSNGSKDAKFTFVITEDLELTATFELADCYVVLTSGEGGRVEGGGVFPYGTDVTIKAIPGMGYQFKEWSDGSKDIERVFTVSGNIVLEARFELKQFEIILAAGDGGNVKGQGTYQIGTEVTIEAMPYAGYVFKEWSNGSKDAKFTFVVTEDLNLTATFEQDTGTKSGGDTTPYVIATVVMFVSMIGVFVATFLIMRK